MWLCLETQLKINLNPERELEVKDLDFLFFRVEINVLPGVRYVVGVIVTIISPHVLLGYYRGRMREGIEEVSEVPNSI